MTEDITDLIQPPAWHEEAACLDMDRDIFFEESKNSWLMLQAKMVCIGNKTSEECPVRLECLQAGMKESWGVFGGMSPHERARLKRAIKRGRSIHQEIDKIDKGTRQRADLLKQREQRTQIEYVQEAERRERNLKRLVEYLRKCNKKKATLVDIATFLREDLSVVLDVIRIARSRGLIEPVYPAYSGHEQTWRLIAEL